MSRKTYSCLIAFSFLLQLFFFPQFISGADDVSATSSRAFSPAPSITANDPRLIAVAADVESGNLREALKRLRELDKQYPDDPIVAFTLGSLFQYGGQYATAISWYDRTIRREGHQAAAYHKRAAARLALHDPRQAALDYFKAWLAEPTLTEAMTDLGLVFLFHGVADQAVRYLSQSVKLNPASARAWYGLGRALGASGKIQAAVAAFDQAIALSPENSVFEIDRAWGAFLLDPVENREYCANVLHRVLASHPYHRRAMEVAAALYDATRNSAGEGGAK